MEIINMFIKTYKTQRRTGKIIFWLVGITILCCLWAVPLNILRSLIRPSSSSPVSTPQKVAATLTPLPTKVIPTPTEGRPGLIPGLAALDIVQSLQERDFACSPVNEGVGYVFRTCDKIDGNLSIHVEILGRNSTSVDYIESTVKQYANPQQGIVLEFLGFMASLLDDETASDEAKAWVEGSIPVLKGAGDIHEDEFGGVAYRLFGIPTAITLEMGVHP